MNRKDYLISIIREEGKRQHNDLLLDFMNYSDITSLKEATVIQLEIYIREMKIKRWLKQNVD